MLANLLRIYVLKILITTEFYLPLRCGVTVAVLNLKKALEMKGHEVRILTIGANKESYYKDGVYYIKSNLPQFYKDSYATLAFGGKMFKDIVAWHPDIVHSQCEFFTMIYAKKVAGKLGIPIVHTCHTDFDSYRIHFTKSVRLWNFMTKTFIPRLLKKVSHLICPTDKMVDVLKGYGVKNPISVVPTGLDLGKYKTEISAEERRELRSSFGFTDDDFVFISVCRLSEEKNVGESVANIAALHEIFHSVRFLIVGDGTYRGELEKQVEELGIADSVHFTGSVPMEDVWRYYQTGDFFISSSLSETQGLTYFEALASGVPIICRPDEALMTFITVGYNGFVFSSKDEFIAIMDRLLSDGKSLEEMRRNARPSVDEYSLDVFGDRILSIYSCTLN